MENLPAKFNVLGVGVHALRFEHARDLIRARARAACAARDTSAIPRGAYVCFCDANNITCARRDPAHRARLAQAWLVTPDGMPLVWMGRLQKGRAAVERVYGPDMMLALCDKSENTGENTTAPYPTLSHFFYGGGEGTAQLLVEKLRARFPNLRVAGAQTPPYHEQTDAELAALAAHINQLSPDFLWVGLGAPKQEKFMSRLAPLLNGTVLLGVGAAFDFHSGRVKQAPRWMRRAGLEWLHRLCAEPRRLAPRYLINAPHFAARALAQICRLKKYPVE